MLETILSGFCDKFEIYGKFESLFGFNHNNLNSPGYFVNCRTISPQANCLRTEMNISVSKLKCYNRHMWQFNDVNEAELCNELANFDWDAEVFSTSYDINDIYSCWFKHFHNIVKTELFQTR